MFARFRGAPPPAARPAPPPTPSTHYGQGVPDEDIPIDVKYSKLLEWLVDRKKTRADWREKLRAIQATTASLVRSLPSHLLRLHGLGVPDASIFVGDGGDGVGWDYFRCVLVRDAIVAGASTAARAQGGAVAEEEEEEKEKEEPEKDVEDVGGEMTEANVDDGGDGDGDGDGDADAPTRGLFGRLAGVAKKWDDVVRAYERDGLHLPETALAMARGVDLEIPHHDAKAARASKQLADLDRRESELKRGVGVAREAYKSACDALGVSAAAAAAGRGGDGGNGGKAFAEELKRIAGGLDDAFAECAALARKSDVGEAMTRYAEWCAWAHGDARGAETFTPTLLELRAYEDGATIEPPATTTTAAAAAAAVDDAAPPPPTIVEPPSGGIDWDIGDASAGGPEVVAPPAGGIDWDLGDLAADGGGDDAADGAAMIVEPPAGGIDWDLDLGVEVEVEPTGEAPTVVEAPEGGIDWGIAVEDVAPAEEDDDAADGGFSLDAAMASVATIDVSSTATAIAARVPFHARLRDQDFRAALVNELSELAAFFSQRVADSRSPETTSLLASAPASIQRSSAPDVLADLRAAVLAPVATLRAARTRKLLLIASSERYARRLASELESKARAEGKARSYSDWFPYDRVGAVNADP